MASGNMGDSKPQPGFSRHAEKLKFPPGDVTEKLRKLEIEKTEEPENAAGASRFDAQESEAKIPNTRESSSSAFRKGQRQPTAKVKYPDPSMDFPFLNDPQTVELIKQSKVLFIMRGLSGSGKSTLAKAIEMMYDPTVICSANDHFMRNGKYMFYASGLSEAHNKCQRKAQDACLKNVPAVVVDNTNVEKWEMEFYLNLAGDFNYVVLLVEPRTSWKRNPAELAAKNIHGLTAETLTKKLRNFETVIPQYYGWFLNKSSSEDVDAIARRLLKECATHFPEFKERLQRELQRFRPTRGGYVSPSADTASDVLWEHYTCGRRVGGLLHCTAMYCRNDPLDRARTYHSKPEVEKSLGRAFPLEIHSMCFSPRSIGARIKLNIDQLSLFDKPEERGQSDKGLGAAGSRASYYRVNPRESACAKPLMKAAGRSAHITVGTGPGFRRMETTFDVLRLCDMEIEKPGCDSDFVPITGGKARYFGDGVCCVYFDPPLRVSSIFSGFYLVRGV